MPDEDNAVRSPIPGIFYRRPDPESDPFASEGDDVEAGAVIGLVEVMKQFHEVRAQSAGRIREFLVANEETVTAGQPLVAFE